MKKILGLIFNRWTMAILGLVAISLLIWFVGPLIAIATYRPLESAKVRWVLIGLIVLFYVCRIIWRFLKAKMANKRLFEGLLKQTPGQPQSNPVGAEEIATLNQRFEEAVGILKQAKLGNKEKKAGFFSLFGRQYVYELPWYIFIGAPGSGKTAALVNSGLKFPLADRFGEAAIRGVGGTRNCDWWFTEEAVLLDTAGRYTTQESNQQADSAAWTGFLQLLKKFRPRRPINGALVTVSIADLLQHSPSQRDVHAKALRKRIQELHEQLGIRFPLYVLVTKADLLAGFMEFFGNFGSEERGQVWGMSFPLNEKASEAAPSADFATEFGALEARLNARLVDRLQEERDVQRRALLYTLPQQFAGLKDILSDFLDKVFSPSRFEEKPLLRGVYFISGTQEGSPIDRVMGSLDHAFRLGRKPLAEMKPSGRSFFIGKLIRDVIFSEAGLAGTNLRWERRRAMLQWSGLALAGLITVSGLFAWSVSYARNKTYVGEVQAQLQGVSKQVEGLNVSGETDVVGLLPVLSSVQQLASTPGMAADNPPLSLGFGLYQGDKLAAASDDSYQRMLRDAFLPRVAMRVEQRLRANQQDNSEALYETLKAYIMLHDARHFDADALKAYVQQDWENNLPREVTDEQRQTLMGHLDTLLSHGAITSPIAADAQLTASIRATLAQTPLSRRAYARLKQLGVGADMPEFTISKAAGPTAPLVFSRKSGKPLTTGVPGLFSYNGYYQAFQLKYEQVTRQLADEEEWVLGITQQDRDRPFDAKTQAGLANEVRRLYLTEYANTWDAFIKDIQVVLGTNQTEAIQSVSILSGPDSPLPDLLRKIVREVTLVKKNELERTLLDRGQEALRTGTAPLNRFFDSRERSTAETVSQPESIVDDRFDGLRRMVTPPAAGQPAPIDAAIGLIKEMHGYMTTVEATTKIGVPPPPDTTSPKVKAEASQMPEPLRSALLTIATGAVNQIEKDKIRIVSQQLGPAVGDFCNKAIAGRYPLTKGSQRDVTQDDFAHLFAPAPAGLLDEFFQKKLIDLVDTTTKPWSYRQPSDQRITDSTGALLQFQRAQTIRDVFFRNGGRTAGMRLDFKPVEMDASITQFILDIDGQIIKYSHGPQVPQPIQWPGPRGSSQVRLQISPPSTNAPFGPFEGPWALFRMFDHDQVKIDSTAQPEKFLVTFNIDGRKAQFEVVTNSVQNPFRLRELGQFQCPNKL